MDRYYFPRNNWSKPLGEVSLHSNFFYPVSVLTRTFRDQSLQFLAVEDFEKTVDLLFSYFSKLNQPELLEARCPYFAHPWPSALGLCEWLISHSNTAINWSEQAVLEIGCGLALPSLLLAKLGCPVTASDSHPDFVWFLNQNKKLNHLSTYPLASLFDWKPAETSPSKIRSQFNWILASDVLYEADQPERVADTFSMLLKANGTFVLADPGRPYLQAFVDQAEARSFAVKIDSIQLPITRQEIFLLVGTRS